MQATPGSERPVWPIYTTPFTWFFFSSLKTQLIALLLQGDFLALHTVLPTEASLFPEVSRCSIFMYRGDME